MVQFEIDLNSVENSSKIIRCKANAKDIHNSIYYVLTCGDYDNYISIEDAIKIASWAEIATIGEDYVTNDITVICQEV
ncbi:MAG: hypothetical protein MJ237_09750 [bacterium]|nr:hypothetical protein [bacterium]